MAAPSGTQRGRIAYVDGTIEDITEYRQLEERFRQSQKVQAIGQLAGGIAHDFNNILTVISGYSQLLIAKEGFSDDVRTNLCRIHEAGQRAAELTRQLLAFSRKQRLQPRVIYLNAITGEMDPMLQRLVGENIRIRTIAVSGLSPVKADPSQIQQVVMNLVVNARDAMPNGGQLTIETANVKLGAEYVQSHHDVAAGDYVMLAVSDTGTGMSPEVQARLFEPFFTTKAPGYGTGLGLATCHGIVKQSGGHIAAYSEVGHGTTFKVFLPSVQAQPTPAAPDPVQVKQHGAGERILLVEDDRDGSRVRKRGSSGPWLQRNFGVERPGSSRLPKRAAGNRPGGDRRHHAKYGRPQTRGEDPTGGSQRAGYIHVRIHVRRSRRD